MIEQQSELFQSLIRQLRFDFSAHGDLARRRTGLLWFRGEEIYYRRRSIKKLEFELQGVGYELTLA